VAIRLQGIVVPGIGEVPVQAIQALPYLMTVILLAGVIGTAIPRAPPACLCEGALVSSLVPCSKPPRPCRQGYVPYSRFKVGAAIRTPARHPMPAAMSENAAYPQGAWRRDGAISAMIAAARAASRRSW
jgi:hypothetical protein